MENAQQPKRLKRPVADQEQSDCPLQMKMSAQQSQGPTTFKLNARGILVNTPGGKYLGEHVMVKKCCESNKYVVMLLHSPGPKLLLVRGDQMEGIEKDAVDMP